MNDEVAKDSEGSLVPKLSKWALWIFAAVGFLASVVTISQYFQNSTGVLQVKITPHPALIHGTILKAFGEKDNPGYILDIAKTNKDFYCRNLDKQSKSKLTETESKSIDLECKKYESFESLAGLIGMYSDGRNSFLEYEILNTGSKSATGIKIKSSSIIDAEILKDDSERVDLKRSDNDTYKLPDLNPNEKITVIFLYGRSMDFLDSEFSDKEYFPNITYNGSSTSVSVTKHAPEFYANVYYFFSDMHFIFVGLFIIAVSFLIVILIIVPVAIISGIIQGKTFAEIFATQVEDK